METRGRELTMSVRGLDEIAQAAAVLHAALELQVRRIGVIEGRDRAILGVRQGLQEIGDVERVRLELGWELVAVAFQVVALLLQRRRQGLRERVGASNLVGAAGDASDVGAGELHQPSQRAPDAHAEIGGAHAGSQPRAKFCSQNAMDRLKLQPGRIGAMWNASPQPYAKNSVMSVKYRSAASLLFAGSLGGPAPFQAVAPP
jgi:hypothetical protein